MSNFQSTSQQPSSEDPVPSTNSQRGASDLPDTTIPPSIDRSLAPESAETNPAQLARNLEKRRLLVLANKKDGDGVVSDAGATSAPATEGAMWSMDAVVPAAASESGRDQASPGRSASPYSDPASPHRLLRSASPRHLSPATSMIFERDVQENVVVSELAPAVPNHIQTEDHIPAVLEASSLAITDEKLGPDDVEIVMHTAHQPAAISAPGGSSLGESLASYNELGLGVRDMDESSSNYGALDTNDPRRLSFISFADVVHAEHVENKDPVSLLSLSSAGGSIAGNRSPSPIRSPLSAQPRRMSPPMSGENFAKAAEASPLRAMAPIGSPVSTHSSTHGELTIETMRQTLEKTGSNDQPLIATGADVGYRPSRGSNAGL